MSDTWAVQEKISLDFRSKKGYARNVRATYIALLEKVVERLKETGGGDMPVDSKGKTEDTPRYALPTVIYTRVDQEPASDYISLQLVCFADMRDFRRTMGLYSLLENQKDEDV